MCNASIDNTHNNYITAFQLLYKSISTQTASTHAWMSEDSCRESLRLQVRKEDCVTKGDYAVLVRKCGGEELGGGRGEKKDASKQVKMVSPR